VEKTVSQQVGFTKANLRQTTSSDLMSVIPKGSSFNPKDVAAVFGSIPVRLLIILDEFDRLDHNRFALSDFTELERLHPDWKIIGIRRAAPASCLQSICISLKPPVHEGRFQSG
jgi:hypothetical protein